MIKIDILTTEEPSWQALTEEALIAVGNKLISINRVEKTGSIFVRFNIDDAPSSTTTWEGIASGVVSSHDSNVQTVRDIAVSLRAAAKSDLANMPGWMDTSSEDTLAYWDNNVVPDLTSAGFSAASRQFLRYWLEATLLMRDALFADDVAQQM